MASTTLEAAQGFMELGNGLMRCVAAGGLAALAGHLGYKLEGLPDMKRQSFAAMTIAGAVAALPTALLEIDGLDVALFLPIFFAFIGVTAIVDRASFFAPHMLYFPIVACAGFFGATIGGAGWPGSPIIMGGIAAAGYAMLHVGWAIRAKIDPEAQMMPPADLFGFVLPFLMFGLGFRAGACVLLFTVLAFSTLKSTFIHRIFVDPSEARELALYVNPEATEDDIRRQVPFLMFVLPSIWICAVCVLIWQLMGDTL